MPKSAAGLTPHASACLSRRRRRCPRRRHHQGAPPYPAGRRPARPVEPQRPLNATGRLARCHDALRLLAPHPSPSAEVRMQSSMARMLRQTRNGKVFASYPMPIMSTSFTPRSGLVGLIRCLTAHTGACATVVFRRRPPDTCRHRADCFPDVALRLISREFAHRSGADRLTGHVWLVRVPYKGCANPRAA